MHLAGMMGLSALLSISGSPGLGAEEWDNFRAMMGAYDDTVAISERLASLLSEDNDDGLGKLAEDVRRQLGGRYLQLVYDGYGLEPEPDQSEMEHLDALVLHVTRLGVFADDRAAQGAMESMGACETAGVLVRNVVLQLADGDKEHRTEKGRIFIDGTSNDERYAVALARCQIAKRHKLAPAAIGYSQTACQASRQSECPEVVDR